MKPILFITALLFTIVGINSCSEDLLSDSDGSTTPKNDTSSTSMTIDTAVTSILRTDTTVSDTSCQSIEVLSNTDIDTSVTSRVETDTIDEVRVVSDTTFTETTLIERTITDTTVSTNIVSDRVIVDSLISDTTYKNVLITDTVFSDSSFATSEITERVISDTVMSDTVVRGITVTSDTLSDITASMDIFSDTAAVISTTTDTTVADLNMITNEDLFGIWTCSYTYKDDSYTEVYNFKSDLTLTLVVTRKGTYFDAYDEEYEGAWRMYNGHLRVVADLPHSYNIQRNGEGFRLSNNKPIVRFLVRKQ